MSWAYFGAGIALTALPVYAGPGSMFHIFAPGMGLAIVVVLAEGRMIVQSVVAALLRVGWVFLSLFAILLRLQLIYFNLLFGFAFVLVLISTMLGGTQGAWRKMLINPVLQFLGLISYSIYLWHGSIVWILFQTHPIGNSTLYTCPLGLSVVVAVVTAVASMSYWAFERPTRRLRAFFSPVQVDRVPGDMTARIGAARTITTFIPHRRQHDLPIPAGVERVVPIIPPGHDDRV